MKSDLFRRAAIASAALRRRGRAEMATLSIGKPVQVSVGSLSTHDVYRGTGMARFTDCGHYRGCLEFAVLQNWDDFACTGCPDYEMSDEELRRAADAIRASIVNSQRGEI